MITTRALDLSPAGLERSAAMLRTAMPRAGHITADVLHWQYVANPVGPALGLEAYDGERVVSHCVVQPLKARLHGREALGVLSLNAATLPEYLGRGMYFGLAEQVYAAAREAGYEFGVAVTNDRSTPGFLRHCGFHLVRPLDARIGFGAAPLPRPGGAADFEKVWTDETLAWRLSPPHLRYRFEPAGDAARVLAPSGRAGIEVEMGQVPLRCVPASSSATRGRSAPLRLWLGIDDRVDWKRTPFWNLPMRLRPSPLNLIFADLAAAHPPEGVHARWFGLDFDDF